MATTVPKLQWKFMTEGNPFGRKIMTNVAEVVAWMTANFDGDREKIPSLKYLTGGSTLCERQIANLSEVVQAMFDNWGDSMYTAVDTSNTLPEEGASYFVKDENEKYVPGGVKDDGTWDEEATAVYKVAEGVIAPTYAYATETTKPLAILYIENMPKVVGEMYKQMFPEQWEDKDEIELNGSLPETPAADDSGDGDDDTPEYEYTEVDKTEVTTPVSGTTYYISDGEGGYTEGGTADDGEGGLIWDSQVDKVYTRSVKESDPEDAGDDQGDEEDEYVLVDKSEVTQPEEGVTYYVEDGNGGYTEGGVTEQGGWEDVNVYTKKA